MAKRKSAGRWRECMRTAKIGPDIDQVSEKEKHFGWIHLRSLSTWNFLHLSKQTVTLGNLIWLETCCFLYVLVSFVIVVVARSSSLSSVTTQNNSWYATISLKNRRFDGNARRKRRPQVPRGRLIKSPANKCTCWQGAGWEMNENEVEEIPETGSLQPIGHFRVPPSLYIKTRLSAQPLISKWYSRPNKTRFHKKGCALGLILKVRFLELGIGL